MFSSVNGNSNGFSVIGQRELAGVNGGLSMGYVGLSRGDFGVMALPGASGREMLLMDSTPKLTVTPKDSSTMRLPGEPYGGLITPTKEVRDNTIIWGDDNDNSRGCTCD